MKNSKSSLNTKRLSVSGILISLTVIVLIVENILPVNKLSLFALSSFFVAIIITEFGINFGWVFYFSSSLLAIIVVPNKIGLVPYLLFFGIYGIVKFYIEKLNKMPIEYLLKLVIFNAYMIFSLLIIKKFFFDNIKINLPLWLLIFVTEIAFIIYDYVYTLFIQYYKEKLKKFIRL